MADENSTLENGMNGENGGNATVGTNSRTFTQEEVNELMGKVRRETRSKYADYDDLKAKAGKYDEAQEANKSELEKALERAKKAEEALEVANATAEKAALVARVSKATGVPAELLHGSNEDELKACAESLLTWNKTAQYPVDKGGAANAKPETKESIMAIKDKNQRIHAIAANTDLFRR